MGGMECPSGFLFPNRKIGLVQRAKLRCGQIFGSLEFLGPDHNRWSALPILIFVSIF